MQITHSIKRVAITVLGLVALSMTAVAQEIRSEVSVQGTGFFTKDSNGNGIQNQADNTGGVLVGYRYNLTRWLAAEANYGFDRNTQSFVGGSSRRVESNIHTFTGSAVGKVSGYARFNPMCWAAGRSVCI